MSKTGWGDLISRFPEPHIVVAVLPDVAEKATLSNAQSAHRLLVRLIRKVTTKRDFAVTVSRQSGEREVLCAFADGSDARLFANITNASVVGGARYSFLLDESAEEKLAEIAGPPQPYRHPRAALAPPGLSPRPVAGGR